MPNTQWTIRAFDALIDFDPLIPWDYEFRPGPGVIDGGA
jgi:hypothetical protein